VKDFYTDPQIHTLGGFEKAIKTGRTVFGGKGNLGVRGINKFLSTHKCNAICRYLRLPMAQPQASPREIGTVPAQSFMKRESVQVFDVRIEEPDLYDVQEPSERSGLLRTRNTASARSSRSGISHSTDPRRHTQPPRPTITKTSSTEAACSSCTLL
jgi:Alpha-kinase family